MDCLQQSTRLVEPSFKIVVETSLKTGFAKDCKIVTWLLGSLLLLCILLIIKIVMSVRIIHLLNRIVKNFRGIIRVIIVLKFCQEMSQ